MKTYEVMIQLKTSTTKVTVQAKDAAQAKELAERQYGKGCVIRVGGPIR